MRENLGGPIALEHWPMDTDAPECEIRKKNPELKFNICSTCDGNPKICDKNILKRDSPSNDEF